MLEKQAAPPAGWEELGAFAPVYENAAPTSHVANTKANAADLAARFGIDGALIDNPHRLAAERILRRQPASRSQG